MLLEQQIERAQQDDVAFRLRRLRFDQAALGVHLPADVKETITRVLPAERQQFTDTDAREHRDRERGSILRIGVVEQASHCSRLSTFTRRRVSFGRSDLSSARHGFAVISRRRAHCPSILDNGASTPRHVWAA
jgi:hypothetical protein